MQTPEEKSAVTVHEPYAANGSLRTSTDKDSDADTDSIHEAAQDIERIPTRRSRLSEKSTGRVSQDLRRTASNVLSQVASRLSTRIREEPPPPPDGGTRAWLQVGAGFLVIFTTWGYVNAFGAFQTYYTSTLPVSPSSISWIGSVQIFMSLSVGVFTGRLLDAGFFYPTYIVGAIFQLLGIFLMSISTKYWQLMLTQGVLTGLGNGIFFTPTLAMITTYFSKRRGIAVGLVTTGNSTGGALYPVITRQLLPQIGFAWTTRALGLINLVFLATGLILLKPRLPPRKSGPMVDLTALKEPVFLAFVFAVFFSMWANYYTFYYIASFGRETLGLSYQASTLLVVIINAVGIPMRLTVPLIADRVGPVNTLVPIFLIWTVASFCWLAVKDIPGYYVFTCFYGAVSGAVQSSIPTAIASLTPRLDMMGARIGMGFGIVSVAALTGPPIGGAIQGASDGKFTGSQAWAACVMAIGFCLITTARLKKVGWTVMQRC
ncbi:hypothetical protein JX266_008462 [Neoarthrinium moseri]|nr:hypothetical protein JX266_008462 [Neoarthrinium moseri]